MEYDFKNPRPLPETYPLKDGLTGADLAFSTASGDLHNGGAYLSYYDGQCSLVESKWEDRANHLFFRGGKLEDIGLQLKDQVDPASFFRTLRWLLSSWSPKQEQKSATVGFVLASHCDEISTPNTTTA